MLGTLDCAWNYGTAAMHEIFSDRGFANAFLEVERAVLRVEEELGIVPPGESQKLSRLRSADFDLGAATEKAVLTGNPLVGLVDQLYRVSAYAHFGITGNDAYDVAHVLQLRAATGLILQDLRRAIKGLMHLAEENADTPMLARTQGQAGAPTTLGFKFAMWLDELLRGAERLTGAMNEAALVSVAGVAGTASSFSVIGASSGAVELATARALGLRTSATPWITSRDRFVALVSAFAQICTGAGKIGHEIYNMQRTGIEELAEGGAFGSTAAPQKTNSWIAQKMHGLAVICRNLASLISDSAALPEGEREIGTMYAEWFGLTQLYMVGGRLASDLAKLVGDVEVHKDKMKENLENNPAVLSESLSMILSREIGKEHGHELMKDAMAQYRAGRPYAEAVADAFRQGSVEIPKETSSLPGVLGWARDRTYSVAATARDWLQVNPE